MSHQVLNVSRNTISSFGVALKSLHFHGTGSVSVSPETGALCVLSAALGPLAPCELLARPGDEHCWNDFCLAFAWLLVVFRFLKPQCLNIQLVAVTTCWDQPEVPGQCCGSMPPFWPPRVCATRAQ